MLQLSNVDYQNGALLAPWVREVAVSDPGSLAKAIVEPEKQMTAAAKRLELEEATSIRDRLKELHSQQIYKTERTGGEARNPPGPRERHPTAA